MDSQEPKLGPVFLSASIPDPKRDPKYSAKVDVIAIREATSALAEVVLPGHELHFGGHPAISPLIAAIAKSLDRFDSVTVYQSELFRQVVPPTTLVFDRIEWTDAVANDRKKSLEHMRRRMLDPNAGSPRYLAGFFIGGMEGIEDELELFRKYQPQATFWPIASTGGAAALEYFRIFDPIVSQAAVIRLGAARAKELLERTLTYRQCVRELLSVS